MSSLSQVAPSLADGPAHTVRTNQPLPPVVLIEGQDSPNGLSVARCLGRRGIPIYAVCPAASILRRSRYVRWIPEKEAGLTAPEWANYLLGPAAESLRGAVVLACFDAALQFLSQQRTELLTRYRLDECHPPAQLCMLDKLNTYRAAVEAGVLTPKFWVAQNKEQVLACKDQFVYPLLVKPLLSHVYRQRFNTKFATAHNFDELWEGYAQAAEAGIDVMLVEKIPGGDDRLCSYFTYLDAEGNALFDFTKRVIRRYPITSGPGCCHVTDWLPELKEPALKLFRHVGLRGVANVEFKRDDRDGQLKLIECNARFTASNGLVADSGYDLAWFVYSRIVGLPQPVLGPFRQGKRLWYPVEDFYAFWQLRRQKQLTFWQWLKSVAHPTTFPYFRWTDPWPTMVQESRRVREAVKRRLRKWLPSGKV